MTWILAILVLAVIAAVLVFNNWTKLAGFPEPPPPDGPQSFSVRIGTYNVAMLPPAAAEPTGGQLQKRAKQIAHQINASGYDIICLNELFYDEAQEIFFKILHDEGPYKYCVYDINNDLAGADVDQDSGLAIYSKWPFDPLPPPKSKDFPTGDYVAFAGGAEWSQVAFKSFAQSKKLADSWAAKGVAYVAIRHPQGHSRYHVFFAHLNDDLGADDLETIEKDKALHHSQLDDIAGLMEHFLTPEILAFENVFLTGDFNIDGNPRSFHFVDGEAAPGEVAIGQKLLSIWLDRFHNPQSTFTITLWDCWFFEAPHPPIWEGSNWGKRDPEEEAKYDDGRTKYNRRRLDFFLRNAPAYRDRDALWVQHFTRGLHLRVDPPFAEAGPEWDGALAGIADLSDHLAIAVDLNRVNPHCSTLDPGTLQGFLDSGMVIPIASTNLVEAGVRVLAKADIEVMLQLTDPPTPGDDFIVSGTIADPGAMQWLRIDKPGTYSVGFIAGGDGLQYRLYPSTDLSVPIPQYQDKFFSNGLTGPVTHTIIVGDQFSAEGSFGPGSTPSPSDDPLAVAFTFEELPFTGKTHHVSAEPFYIRIFHTDRTWTGDYQLRIHKHGCTSENDICYLEPYAVETHHFASDAGLNSTTEAWFGLAMERLDTGNPQQLAFWADCDKDELATLALSEPGQPAMAQADSAQKQAPLWDTAPGPSSTERFVLSIEKGDLAGPGELRLIVSRKDPGPNPTDLSFDVGWTTDLNVLYDDPARPISLYCDAQDDATGDDSISLIIVVDGTLEKLPKTNLGQFDDEQERYLMGIIPQAFPIRYAAEVAFHLIERDDDPDPDDVQVRTLAPMATLPGVAGVTDLRKQKQPVNCEIRFVFPGSFSDGEYTFYGRVAHGLPGKKAS
ncbi:MAG TPA: endonuclease/exonuclease/phosphatase family protein [Beijerinckiaceae bacterium]|jgi:hypothetical protein